MDNHEIIALLKFNFKYDLLGVSSPRNNRTIVEINPAVLPVMAKYLFKEHNLRFIIASALDTGASFEIFYHFSKDDTGMILNLKASLPRENPEISSLVPLFVAADWIEREMHELFGIMFTGHPDLKPLISDGNWGKEHFPYRKRTENKEKE